VNSQGLTLKTETLFYQSQSVTNALTLVPRESDDVLVIGFNTEYSSVNYRYSYPEVNITPKNQAVTATVEDEGVYETHFHLEVPMTAEAHLPEAFLEVESLWVDGWSTLSISLAPDFPSPRLKSRMPPSRFLPGLTVRNIVPSRIIGKSGPTVRSCPDR
jgi:hypothetical protein